MRNDDSSNTNTNIGTVGTQVNELCPIERLIEIVTYLILLQQYTRVRADDLFLVAQ